MKQLFLLLILITLSNEAISFCGSSGCRYHQVKVESCSSSEEVSREAAIELGYSDEEIEKVISSSKYVSLAKVSLINDVEMVYWYKDNVRHHFKGAVTPYEKVVTADYMLLGKNLEHCQTYFENKEMFIVVSKGINCQRDVIVNNRKDTRSRCLIDFKPMYRFGTSFKDLQDVGIEFPKKNH